MATKGKFFRVVKPLDVNGINRNVKQQIKKRGSRVARGAIKDRKKMVKNFSRRTRPEFSFRVKETPKQILVFIDIKNASKKIGRGTATIGDLWTWLAISGTDPHTIKAKNPNKPLTFVWGGPGSYSAKTRGGSGKVSGRRRFARMVNHPGFPPYLLKERLKQDDKFRKKFREAISRIRV